MSIPKGYIYQMWASDGTYLGVLQGVQSEFKHIQDINTIGPSKITIEVAQSGDNASQPVKAITTEDGKWITTEDGKGLTTEGEPKNYGVDKTKIRNGNTVKIIEVSDYYPNGHTVFRGRVKRWNVNFGTDNNMKLIVEPLSSDTNNHLVKSGQTIKAQQLSGLDQGEMFVGPNASLTSDGKIGYQIGSPTNGANNISSIVVQLAAANASFPVTVTMRLWNLYSGDVPGPGESADLNKLYNNSLEMSEATVIVSGTSFAEYMFTFPIPVAINPNGVYTFTLETTAISGRGVKLWGTSSDVVSSGVIISYHDFNSDGIPTWGLDFPATYDFWYKIYTIPPDTKATVTSFEPSALLKTIVNNYNSEGGVVTYTVDSIDTTGITIDTYTFQVNTVAEALDILLGLSPQGFYYYIDPGTNILYFKRVGTTADHVLTFKREINNLDLSASIENVKNKIFFTGGLSGATNLFLQKTNSVSDAAFGTQIDRISDVRVTNSNVGSSIATNYLDKVDDEAYETNVMIIDTMVDITTFNLGQTVGFKGFGSFADSVIIPIVRLVRDKEKAQLDLGTLPVRQSDILQDSQDQILAMQTVANPTQPS